MYLGRQSTDCQATVDHLSADCRAKVSWQSINNLPTVVLESFSSHFKYPIVQAWFDETRGVGGYSTDAWVGRCGPGVQTLTLFKTHFSYFHILFETEFKIFRPYLRQPPGMRHWSVITAQSTYRGYMPLTNRVQGPYCKLLTVFFPLQFMAWVQSMRVMNWRGRNKVP